jgi:hypothetical protein
VNDVVNRTGGRRMRRSIIALILIGAAITGCTENRHPSPDVATGAAVGPAAPSVNVFEGAAVDAPIAGLAGAVWADPNNTGYVTGYTYQGKYHPGAPPGYDPAKHAVVPSH